MLSLNSNIIGTNSLLGNDNLYMLFKWPYSESFDIE